MTWTKKLSYAINALSHPLKNIDGGISTSLVVIRRHPTEFVCRDWEFHLSTPRPFHLAQRHRTAQFVLILYWCKTVSKTKWFDRSNQSCIYRSIMCRHRLSYSPYYFLIFLVEMSGKIQLQVGLCGTYSSIKNTHNRLSRFKLNIVRLYRRKRGGFSYSERWVYDEFRWMKRTR